MSAFRLEITPALARHMSYHKFANRPIRLLVLEGNYWVDQACARAARAMGWQVQSVPVKMIGMMPRDMLKDLFEAIVTHQPDFVLSVNLSGMDVEGMLAHFLADLQVPHATWFVDGPRAIMAGNTSSVTPYSVAMTWEPAYVPFLESCGFADVFVAPLAVDESLFLQAPFRNHIHPPTFVGDSMIYHAEKEWAIVRENEALKTAVEEAFASGRVDRAHFAEGVHAVLGEVAAPLDDDALYHAERIFFIDGTRRLRRSLVETLAPEGLHVRGDVHWQSVTTQWGEPLNYEDELPAYYRDCPVNLNTTSVQMATTVNQRVFDCPTAGGFLLTDEQAHLHDLFEVDLDIATYRTPEEAREKMQWFLAHPLSRKEFIERGQKRILGEHTYTHRLKAIAARLKEHFSA